MRFYWDLQALPELAPLPLAERKRLWKRVYPQVYRHWQTWLGLLVLGTCAGLGSHLGHTLGAAIGGGIGGGIYSQIIMHMARPHLRQALAEERRGSA